MQARRAREVYRPVLVRMDKHLPDAHSIQVTARLRRPLTSIEEMDIFYWSGGIYVRRALATDARTLLDKDNLIADPVALVEEAIGI